MKKYLVIGAILLSVLSFARFGLVIDNLIVPIEGGTDTYDVGGIFVTLGGLRLFAGPLDVGIVTPVYVGVYTSEGMIGVPAPIGFLWAIYGGLRVGSPIYLYGRGVYVLQSGILSGESQYEQFSTFMGVAGLGINIINLFLEVGTFFEFQDVVNTAFKFYHFGVGLQF